VGATRKKKKFSIHYMQTDGWANKTKLIWAFSQVSIINVPKRIYSVVPAYFFLIFVPYNNYIIRS
jgi:hypothetical protein